MNVGFEEREFCAVCGRDATGEHWFCHFYEEHGRITFCSPRCADSFLHHANGSGGENRMSAWDDADVPHLIPVRFQE